MQSSKSMNIYNIYWGHIWSTFNVQNNNFAYIAECMFKNVRKTFLLQPPNAGELTLWHIIVAERKNATKNLISCCIKKWEGATDLFTDRYNVKLSSNSCILSLH